MKRLRKVYTKVVDTISNKLRASGDWNGVNGVNLIDRHLGLARVVNVVAYLSSRISYDPIETEERE